jgi:hypothetical protein
MPWNAGDSSRFTHRANTPEKQAAWAEEANRVLKQTGDEGAAVKSANSAIKHFHDGMHAVRAVAHKRPEGEHPRPGRHPNDGYLDKLTGRKTA